MGRTKGIIGLTTIQEIKQISGTWQNLFYPRECPICQQCIPRNANVKVHMECYKKMKRIVSPMCQQCGKPLVSYEQEYCEDCRRRRHSFESGPGLWLYDSNSAASVFAYKYNGKQRYADFYIEVLLHFYGDWIESLRVDCIVPIPLEKRRYRQRGFNQAELIAEGLGENLQISVKGHGLYRVRETAPQKELGRDERKKNLAKAFLADKEAFKDVKRVLLIDDIYTTGSTIEYCTRALKGVGIEKVWFLTLCIGGSI